MHAQDSSVPVNVMLVKDDAIAVIFEIKVGQLEFAAGCSFEPQGPLTNRRFLVAALAADNDVMVAAVLDLDVTGSDGWVQVSPCSRRPHDRRLPLTSSSFSLRIPIAVWHEILGLMKTLLT
jgi:hypothetical protein